MKQNILQKEIIILMRQCESKLFFLVFSQDLIHFHVYNVYNTSQEIIVNISRFVAKCVSNVAVQCLT